MLSILEKPTVQPEQLQSPPAQDPAQQEVQEHPPILIVLVFGVGSLVKCFIWLVMIGLKVLSVVV